MKQFKQTNRGRVFKNTIIDMPLFAPLFLWKQTHSIQYLHFFLNKISENVDGNDTDKILKNFEEVLDENALEKAKTKDLVFIRSVLLSYQKFIDEILLFDRDEKYEKMYEAIGNLVDKDQLLQKILNQDYGNKRSFLESITGSISNKYNLFIEVTNMRINEANKKVSKIPEFNLEDYDEDFLQSLRVAISLQAISYVHEIQDSLDYTVDGKNDCDDIANANVQSKYHHKSNRAEQKNEYNSDEFEEIPLTPPASVEFQKQQTNNKDPNVSNLKKAEKFSDLKKSMLNFLNDAKQKWQSLPAKWKIAAGFGLGIGCLLAVAGMVFIPPTVAVVVPVVGKVAVSTFVVGGGVALLGATTAGHVAHTVVQSTDIDKSIKQTKSTDNKSQKIKKHKIDDRGDLTNKNENSHSLNGSKNENDIIEDKVVKSTNNIVSDVKLSQQENSILEGFKSSESDIGSEGSTVNDFKYNHDFSDNGPHSMMFQKSSACLKHQAEKNDDDRIDEKFNIS